MSEVMMNILDASRAVHGTIHGSMADAAVAGLADEPETIEELQDAMARFVKPNRDHPPFSGFDSGSDDESWDAGIVFIDMAARVVAVESSYSRPGRKGEVEYHNGVEATDLWLPYELPDDWLFVDTVADYEGICRRRRAERAAAPPYDARPVLFGPVVEFIAGECQAARQLHLNSPVADIHAKWLMTSRPDLRGLCPREVLLVRRDFIDADIHWRERQWTFLQELPPLLKKESSGYQFAGFGTHSNVVYYELMRFLITDCWNRMSSADNVSIPEEIVRIEQLKTDWLESPNPSYGGNSPSCILEYERKRLPWVLSGEQSIIDENCPWCQEMAEHFPIGFWHLDGCNMDEDFPFSFFRTREEWEEENRRRDEFLIGFEKEWKRKERRRARKIKRARFGDSRKNRPRRIGNKFIGKNRKFGGVLM